MRWRAGMAAIIGIGLAVGASAQFKKEQKDPDGAKLAESQVQKLKCGVSLTAGGADCFKIVATTPVPVEWPEQEVKIVEEDISSGAKIAYQTYDAGVKLMVVTVPRLQAGQELHAILTLEIRRSAILPPEKTDRYRLPDVNKLDMKLRPYLGASPMIETRHPKVIAQAKKIAPDEKNAWAKVEAYYDWVRDHVKYKAGPLRGALFALNEAEGDCEEMTSLFIAFCRINNIPARTVHVSGHCYPEFYLVDEAGKGHWFPCQISGSRAFGGMPDVRPIIEKGDNFRDPRNPREHYRYLPETVIAAGSGDKPTVKFIRDLLPN